MTRKSYHSLYLVVERVSPFLCKAFMILVVILALVSPTNAQLSSGDLSTIKVDQLSNEQVQDVYSKFQSSGLSEQQFYASFAQRGMPSQEINKLKDRINQIIQKTKSGNPAGTNRNNGISNDRSSDANQTPVGRIDTLSEYEKKIFGYTVFHNSSTSFAPNLNMATPKGYVVGPSDVLVLQVYGIAQNSYSLTVNKEGNIYIPDISLVHVGGFTIEAIKNILIKTMSIRYAGMTGSNPNTFLEVTISNIRTIKINMVGEVSKPGTFSLPSYINVFDALYASGGPTVKGTFRDIQVYRAGKLVTTLDLYDFLVNGKSSNSIRLEDNDVILIRPAANRIELIGEIRIPGIFEFKNKESFSDVLNFAGGFTDNAYKQMVTVSRKGLVEKQILTLTQSQYTSAVLNDGDSITAEAILDRYSNRVMIAGAVIRPGSFELSKGMTVKDLIQKGGGVKGDAFMKRVLLYRTKPDFTQEVISLDLSASAGRENDADTVLLQREDVLSIANLYDLKEEYYVQISGEVNTAGVFPYAENMNIGDLLLKAGGFKYSASGSFIEIARRNQENEGKSAEIIRVSIDKDLRISEENKKIVLKPFDYVFVRTIPGYQPLKQVIVRGEVLYPGSYVIEKKEMRISDLLKRASGFTKYAYLKGATLLRRTKKYESPTLSEQENERLNKLKQGLEKDREIFGNAESSKLFSNRVDNKIKDNLEAARIEKETKTKENIQDDLFRENTSLLGTSSVIQEKSVELVAIDLDQIIKQPGSSYDLILKEGDLLTIPEVLETVNVRGGVLYPVSIRYEADLGFREYINRSGGYNSKAIRKQAYVLQANGRVQRVKNFLFFKQYPKLEPGAEIFVPVSSVEKPPFNFQNAIGIITTSLTLIFLLKTL